MKRQQYMHIFKIADMPTSGWIQGCFICYSPTARTKQHGYTEDILRRTITEYLVYTCPTCQTLINTHDNLKDKYNHYVTVYINNHSTSSKRGVL